MTGSKSTRSATETSDQIRRCLEAVDEGGDQESSSTCGSTASMDDVESPKSVVGSGAAHHAILLGAGEKIKRSSTIRKGGGGGDCLHIQVLRLREEESHLGVETAISLGDAAGAVFFSKAMATSAMMRASPLGGAKAKAKAKTKPNALDRLGSD